MASGADNPKLQGEGGNPDVSSAIQASVVMAGPMEMLTGSVAERSRQNASESNANSWLRGTVDLQSLGIFSGIKVYPDAKHGCWNQNPWFAEMTAASVIGQAKKAHPFSPCRQHDNPQYCSL